ncbi:TPA: hypothetical protein ACPYU1_004940, partial [Raoultella planticola]
IAYKKIKHTPDDSSIILASAFMAAFTSTRKSVKTAGGAIRYKFCGWHHSFRYSAGEYREAGPY